jgi:hypothetical protein
MQYRAGITWIKFIGTHAQYDMIVSLRMIKHLHDGLSIPYESLLAGAG